MGCSLFSNSHFQMGVTVMGFAEDFGHCFIALVSPEFLSTHLYFVHIKFVNVAFNLSKYLS